MMRTSLVLLVLLVLALAHALPTNRLSRQKRGFRVNSASRVAHGYGKRQFDTWDNEPMKSLPSNQLMAVPDLMQLAVENPSLTEALIEKFIDLDRDNILSSRELLGVDAQ